MPDSNEAALALIIDRLQSIDRQMTHERNNSSMSRQKIYDKLDAFEKELDRTTARLEKVDTALMGMTPTVQEFVKVKTDAQAAGRIGAFLWKAFGVLLSMAAGAAATWAWFWNYFQLR